MNNIKSLAQICAVTLLLSTPAIAGDMPGPGFTQDPPKVESATKLATCEPVIEGGGPNKGTICKQATPDVIVEAMIIAMRLLASVF